ncbi:MAG: KH domain-containing protein [candidate division Zixibacteria bacterium]
MKEFIENIARALVDHPDSVKVTEIEGEKTTVYELRVYSEDLGKVIGRKGQTAKAIRTLISAISAKKGKRALLEILE